MKTLTVPPHAKVLDLVSGKVISRAISLVAEIAIADLLGDGTKSVAQLAEAAEVHEGALRRVLTTLASFELFDKLSDDHFQNNELSHTLRSDHPQSARAYARWFGCRLHWDIWKEFDHSVRTGEPSVLKDNPDGNVFEVLSRDAHAQAVFNEAMTGFTRSEALVLVESFDFSGYRSLIDVGGGHGALALAIKERFPTLEVSVFDLPHVVKSASDLGDSSVKMISGDFFKPVPGTVDACLMKHIIHDWNDQAAAAILRNCACALSEQGEVLVCEMLIHDGPGSQFVKTLDLEMLTGPGGRERTEAEFAELFRQSGLELVRVERTPGPIVVMVGRKLG